MPQLGQFGKTDRDETLVRGAAGRHACCFVLQILNHKHMHIERQIVMMEDNSNLSWSDMKGRIKSKWSRFSDTDLEGFRDRSEAIPGKLISVLGLTKENADREYSEFRKSLNTATPGVTKDHVQPPVAKTG